MSLTRFLNLENDAFVHTPGRPLREATKGLLDRMIAAGEVVRQREPGLIVYWTTDAASTEQMISVAVENGGSTTFEVSEHPSVIMARAKERRLARAKG